STLKRKLPWARKSLPPTTCSPSVTKRSTSRRKHLSAAKKLPPNTSSLAAKKLPPTTSSLAAKKLPPTTSSLAAKTNSSRRRSERKRPPLEKSRRCVISSRPSATR